MAGHRAIWTTLMLIFPILLMCPCLGFASCDLHGFSQHPPAPIQDTVNNQYAHFRWASDFDQDQNGHGWIWNFIDNTGTAGLAVDWKKGRIEYKAWSPIAPGTVACQRWPIHGTTSTDMDAPIIYGTNHQRQDAGVYTEDQQKSQNSATNNGVLIQSTVLDRKGQRRDLDVFIDSRRTSKGVSFTFEFPPGTILGVSRLARAMNKAQLETISHSLDAQNATIQISAMQAFIGEQTKDNIDITTWARDQKEEQYAFIMNVRNKTFFEIPGSDFHNEIAKLVLLDRDHRPLLVSYVDLLFPSANK